MEKEKSHLLLATGSAITRIQRQFHSHSKSRHNKLAKLEEVQQARRGQFAALNEEQQVAQVLVVADWLAGWLADWPSSL